MFLKLEILQVRFAFLLLLYTEIDVLSFTFRGRRTGNNCVRLGFLISNKMSTEYPLTGGQRARIGNNSAAWSNIC